MSQRRAEEEKSCFLLYFQEFVVPLHAIMENNSILQKLDGLEARFEEVSTLITDPDVIADQNRFVKLTKEYKDLGDIMDARKRYIACLNGIKEAKDILANETFAGHVALSVTGKYYADIRIVLPSTRTFVEASLRGFLG